MSYPKHVEFRTRINLEISASVGFMEKWFITMHGRMDVKIEIKFLHMNKEKLNDALYKVH
jgi:hypothetical protein